MLEINSITRHFSNQSNVLENISFSVDKGEIVCLVGGSGCGKSTLLRLIAGLDRPSNGAITLGGEPINAPHPAVGIIFQEPRLFPWLTVAQNIGFGLNNLPRDEQNQRIAAVLEKVGLSDKASHWPRQLSGGQAQRVAIARALVMRPQVLLLDEPFSALDAFTRNDLQEHVLQLWKDERPTLVLVTHDIEEAVVLADRVLVMQPRPGRIAADLPIHLTRPRDRMTHLFDLEKRRILEVLEGSLKRQPQSPAIAGSFGL